MGQINVHMKIFQNFVSTLYRYRYVFNKVHGYMQHHRQHIYNMVHHNS